MKKIALTIAMAFGALACFAEEAAPAAGTNEAAMPNAQCTSGPDGVKCDGSAWLNIETVTLAAANGDPIAQYAVAYITDNGTGDTPKDPQKAQELYKKAAPGLKEAAAKGHPVACRALARMYAEGKGVEKDDAKAAEFMKKCRESCRNDCTRMGCCKPGCCHGQCSKHGGCKQDCCKQGCPHGDKPADSAEESHPEK